MHEHGYGHGTAGVQGPKTETVPRDGASEAKPGSEPAASESSHRVHDWEGEWRVTAGSSAWFSGVGASPLENNLRAGAN
jgi:hypothetical protein